MQAADRVVSAVGAKDVAALKSLAAKDDPDPWLVADELLSRGEAEAAAAFASAAPRKDTESLSPYVEAQRAKSYDAKARAAVDALNAANAAKRFADALAAAEAVVPAGGDVPSIRLAHGSGFALRGLARLEPSAASFLSAAEAAERLGWLARASAGFHEAAMSCTRHADHAGARAAWERKLPVERKRGNRKREGETISNLGNAARNARDLDRALEFTKKAIAICEELGDRRGLARDLSNLGGLHFDRREYDEALVVSGRALALAEELGDRVTIGVALVNLSCVHQVRGDLRTALGLTRRALEIDDAAGDLPGVVLDLRNLADLHSQLGDFGDARRQLERARDIAQQIGDRESLRAALADLGMTWARLGDFPAALLEHERAYEVAVQIGNPYGIADCAHALGKTRHALGDHPGAREWFSRALEIHERLGDRRAIALTLANLGRLHKSTGDLALAVGCLERSLAISDELGERDRAADARASVGDAFRILGDCDRALEHLKRARALHESMGRRGAVAVDLGSIGNVHAELGDHASARDCHERALALAQEIGAEGTIRNAYASLGVAYAELGDPKRGIELLERARALFHAAGEGVGAATCLVNMGNRHVELGDSAAAVECYERGVAEAERLGDAELASVARLDLAIAHLKAGRAGRAMAVARDAEAGLGLLVRGLDDSSAAAARQRKSRVFEVGAAAAVARSDAGEALRFVESGRSGALLELLAVRTVLAPQALPKELREAETLSRGNEAAAAAALRRAVAAGDATAVEIAEKRLRTERDGVRDVVERIQREAKAAAAVAYPTADPADAIRSRLRPDEALVLYQANADAETGLLDTLAVVVTAQAVRIVALGRTAEIEAACAALRADDAKADPAAPAAALRKLVVEPLGIGAATTRLLVSPDGALSYVPFALLAPEREVAYVPSGTTYGVLLSDAGLRGEGVLALGDPDYGSKRPADLVAFAELHRGSMELTPLPATAAEAKAVGTTLLLGKEATEGGLRSALASKPRWRAVHFACHGLVDPARPLLSALAVTPSEADDGFLSAQDVFRMKVPADLAVLSACETGRGKVCRAEGIVGLTRAFMFAGAPRVLVSLWKVDDAATQALMTKFYERWNPKDGKGIAAAAALREAQAHVRSQAKWAHPRFWAAWVLWGLPD